MMRAQEILDVLDRTCVGDFPMLDHGYLSLAAMRLSLHRSPGDWAVVIELFGHHPRAGLPEIWTYTLASTIRDREPPPRGTDPDKHSQWVARYHPHDEVHFFHPLRDGDWHDATDVFGEVTDVELRGRCVPLPAREEYSRLGIELEHPDRVGLHELARFLAEVARDDVLATPHERRAHVPLELEEILVLDEWTHPDVACSERPSQLESFQQIARVLETGNVTLYRPTTPPNTHWKHWPEGGTL
jgi:hypothetical protein